MDLCRGRKKKKMQLIKSYSVECAECKSYDSFFINKTVVLPECEETKKAEQHFRDEGWWCFSSGWLCQGCFNTYVAGEL